MASNEGISVSVLHMRGIIAEIYNVTVTSQA